MDFVKAYNEATSSQTGMILPAEVSIYEDRSFTFVIKTPPAAALLRQAARVEKGSAEPHKVKVGSVTKAQVKADRRDQDARPQRQRHRRCDEDGRGHRPLDGNHGRRLTTADG